MDWHSRSECQGRGSIDQLPETTTTELPSGVNTKMQERNRFKANRKSQMDVHYTKRTKMPRLRTHTNASAPTWSRSPSRGSARQAHYTCRTRLKRVSPKCPDWACGIERSPNISMPADVLAHSSYDRDAGCRGMRCLVALQWAWQARQLPTWSC